ncbi:lipoprotein VacJ-like protein [Legionella beliardensis]|uniref:Lipoprotein VacJ-like protein n=1 Tax=Legionella beliardensis TaxID=91822 RepID=A0A378I4F7_9GAMM|nr:lipoprotein VacJ-like protein [Legionella beliardensis]
MHLKLTTIISSLLLCSCIHKGPNPDDPYESFNRKVHNFNMAFDATMLKPPAKFYKAVIPGPIRVSVNNAYNNVNMIPTVANDILQAEFSYAIKDTWRFLINSTLGIGGLFDVAAARFSLPPHSNDLGLTFAKWGNKKSPYLVIPFLGPSTVRDGFGMLGEYFLLTPYPYISYDNHAVLYSLLGLRYVDLRSQYLETDHILEEALDKYTFLRDAYLQSRNYQITGEMASTDSDTDDLYIDGDDESDTQEAGADYVDEDSSETEAAVVAITDKSVNEVTNSIITNKTNNLLATKDDNTADKSTRTMTHNSENKTPS